MSELLLSEVLPLRSTKSLGDYSQDEILPHIFGDLRDAPFPLIRLTELRYFVADHPMTVTQVYIDRQESFSWAQELESDTASHTWTVVVFSAPIPQGADVSAAGTGRLDDATGALITNPADIAARICTLAGRNDDWSALRAECSGLNIQIAGRIHERLSVKAQIDAVMQSCAAIWAHGMARLYPSSATPSPALALDKSEVDAIDVSASLTDTCDILRVGYDVSDASGRAQHFIELTASPQRYGGLTKEVEYAWLRTPANAEAISRPVLQRLAAERYDVVIMSKNRSLRPGHEVIIVGHPDWPLPYGDPTVAILAVEVFQDSASIRATGEYIVGTATVTVTAHSLALPDTVEAGIDVAVKDGVATFTITDADGRPVAGARVSLDGGAPKTTDTQGKVSFPATPGTHTLDVEAPGFAPISIVVEL